MPRTVWALMLRNNLKLSDTAYMYTDRKEAVQAMYDNPPRTDWCLIKVEREDD